MAWDWRTRDSSLPVTSISANTYVSNFNMLHIPITRQQARFVMQFLMQSYIYLTLLNKLRGVPNRHATLWGYM